MKSYYSPITDHPELPSQTSPQQRVNRKGENTGMVLCPMKLSEIGIERCWMYQKQSKVQSPMSKSCGEGCKTKAKQSQIRAVRKAKKDKTDYGKVHEHNKTPGMPQD